MLNASPIKVEKYLDALPAQMEYIRSWIQYGATLAVFIMSASDLMYFSKIYQDPRTRNTKPPYIIIP